MKKGDFWKIVMIFFTLTAMAGCAGQAFNKAKELNTVAAYDDRQLREKAVLSAKSTEKLPGCQQIACGPCPDNIGLIEKLNKIVNDQRTSIIGIETEINHLKCVIKLNTATKKELKSVRGIGRILAKRIIAGRPYKTIDDLKKIKGIDQKKLETIRSDCFGSE